jgi:hypothetical protein
MNLEEPLEVPKSYQETLGEKHWIRQTTDIDSDRMTCLDADSETEAKFLFYFQETMDGKI